MPTQRGPQPAGYAPAGPTGPAGTGIIGGLGPDSPQPRFDQFAPAGAPAPARPDATGATGAVEPKPERKVRLIIGVLVGCAALLAIAFGGLIFIDKLVGPPFEVGDCVKQVEKSAEEAPCSEEGAYRVVSSVSSSDECDKAQPFLKIENEFYCLQPVAAP